MYGLSRDAGAREVVYVLSPSLLLRPWAEGDAAALREAIDEDLDHLKPWLGWTLEEPATLEQTRMRLRRFSEEFRNGEALRYAITPADDPSCILGGVHLRCRVGPNAHDLGYWVRKSATRQGIARAAVARLVVHAIEEQGVDRLVIQCDVGNAASAAFAVRLGFEERGEVVGAYADGAERRLVEFEMGMRRWDSGWAPQFRGWAVGVRLVGA